MTLLDDVRRLIAAFDENTGLALQGSENTRACRLCKGMLTYHDDAPAQRHHSVDCPILALPRIVAALEAAERLAPFIPRFVDHGDLRCFGCYEVLNNERLLMGHEDDCPTMALVTALQGKEVTT